MISGFLRLSGIVGSVSGVGMVAAGLAGSGSGWAAGGVVLLLVSLLVFAVGRIAQDLVGRGGRE